MERVDITLEIHGNEEAVLEAIIEDVLMLGESVAVLRNDGAGRLVPDENTRRTV